MTYYKLSHLWLYTIYITIILIKFIDFDCDFIISYINSTKVIEFFEFGCDFTVVDFALLFLSKVSIMTTLCTPTRYIIYSNN